MSGFPQRNSFPMLGGESSQSSSLATELSSPSILFGIGILALIVLTGCDAPINEFPPNSLFVKRLEFTESLDLTEANEDVHDALEDYFGTPDEPLWPKIAEITSPGLLKTERLSRAAGAVSSDEQGKHVGLFREHCVVCHGISGNGRGPTSSLLNPYPRDFRMGRFKFKSTPIGDKPTRRDLQKVLDHGIVGTSMPAFHLLDDDDVEALVDYLVYLSVRGEVERRLLSVAAHEVDLEGGERLYDRKLDDKEELSQQQGDIEAEIEEVVSKWSAADAAVTSVEGPPSGFPLVGSGNAGVTKSIANGKKLFQGNVAGCAFCHGQEAKGDGQINNYDDWTRDWTSLAGLRPGNLDELQPMLAVGALKPRNILPRNLTKGIYRGGSTPEDLYLRVVNGIEGTPMPAAPLKPQNPQGLTNEEVWDIVNYLLSLKPEGSGKPEDRKRDDDSSHQADTALNFELGAEASNG